MDQKTNGDYPHNFKRAITQRAWNNLSEQHSEIATGLELDVRSGVTLAQLISVIKQEVTLPDLQVWYRQAAEWLIAEREEAADCAD